MQVPANQRQLSRPERRIITSRPISFTAALIYFSKCCCTVPIKKKFWRIEEKFSSAATSIQLHSIFLGTWPVSLPLLLLDSPPFTSQFTVTLAQHRFCARTLFSPFAPPAFPALPRPQKRLPGSPTLIKSSQATYISLPSLHTHTFVSSPSHQKTSKMGKEKLHVSVKA